MEIHSEPVRIPVPDATLNAQLSIPDGARSAIVFAQGRGTCHDNPIDTFLATSYQHSGFATLLLDLYTPAEIEEDAMDAHHRFRTTMLGDRLTAVVDWLVQSSATHHLNIGLMAASTGGAGALIAASNRSDLVSAVVCRAARPDLAGDALEYVTAPTLLVIGAEDHVVITLNEKALTRLPPHAHLRTIANVGHEFVEPGALEQLAEISLDWFNRHLSHNRAE